MSGDGWDVVPRSFYDRDATVVAPKLLNKILVHDADEGVAAGRIVEAEAYAGLRDPGSHAYRGRTPRNATMFGPAGHLYVYFTYGMHFCANAVCGPGGEPTAVLLRALAPLEGFELMARRRGGGARRPADLASGPAKLCQALGIDRRFDGTDVVTGEAGVRIIDDGTPPPRRPGRSTRIGLNAGADRRWRWFVASDPNVSRFR